MSTHESPDTTYTTTWTNGRGEVRFFTRPDGSRLRYYTAGTGPPLVLIHTVRSQLDYFQRVIPLLWDHYTVYAVVRHRPRRTVRGAAVAICGGRIRQWTEP